MAVSHTPKYATGGIVSISHAPLGTLSAETTFTEYFYTTKDSLSAAQPDATKNNILVDQIEMPVYVSHTAAALEVTGEIPDTAKDLLEFIYETTATDPYSDTLTHTATGVKLGVNMIEGMWKITYESGVSILILNGTFIANWAGDNFSTASLRHTFRIAVKDNGAAADVVFWIPN